MSSLNQNAPVESDQALDVIEHVRLLRDGIINNSAPLVAGLIGLFLVPIMLNSLGTEAYGLWIAIGAVVAMLGLLDLGLGFSVTREVAAVPQEEINPETAGFVVSAGNAFLAVGVLGAAMIAGLALPLRDALRLSAETRAVAPAVFLLFGVAFLGEQVLAFKMSVLQGLRRFDVNNLLLIAASVVRAGGIILLLAAGAGLLALAAWHVATTAFIVFLASRILARLAPLLRLRLGTVQWNLLRAHLPFSLASQMVSAAMSVIWGAGPLLIGVVSGSARIVPYHIGQRFPVIVSGLAWRAAEVSFPAASEHERSGDLARLRETLVGATRSTLILALPLCLVLLLLAPELLQTWLGEVDRDALLVLYLTVGAALADAVWIAALHVVWGRGQVRTVLQTVAGVAVATLGLGLILLLRLGIVGMALAMTASMLVGSLVLLSQAARLCRLPVRALSGRAFKGLLLPLAAGTIVVYGLDYWIDLVGWVRVMGASLAGGLAYAVVFYFSGTQEGEKALLKSAAEWPFDFAHAGYRGMRRALKRIGPLRSTYYLLLAVIEILRDRPTGSRAEFEHVYDAQHDPYGFDTTPREQDRLRHAMTMLEAVAGHGNFKKALEIGCSEGAFTEVLAPRCDSLLAVDVSPTALGRARARLHQTNAVHFREWDLRQDSLTDQFDLIVIMSVLDCFSNPRAIHQARTKLVNALAPGGYLLASNVSVVPLYDQVWWTRYLLRGGRRINQFLARHPSLREVATERGSFYVHTLLQKRT